MNKFDSIALMTKGQKKIKLCADVTFLADDDTASYSLKEEREYDADYDIPDEYFACD